MIIQHNIMAINSHRQLGINNSNLAKNLEKLSSGYRINRAADDAAGLAISEKMRAQITGIDRAVLNAQDGASLIQTAEGALAEVHGMLNRMVELATESANGTIQASDRQKIESEVTALKGEIDRISKATNFNGIQLLDGSLSTKAAKDITVKGFTLTETAATANSTTFAAMAPTTLVTGDTVSITLAMDDNTEITMNFTYDDVNNRLVSDADGAKYNIATADGAITAEELAKAVVGELSKNAGFKDKFVVTQTSGALAFEAKTTGEKAPQVVGLTNTLVHADRTVDTDVVAYGTDGFVAGVDVSFTFDFAELVAFDAEEGNEEDAIFEVNGYKFAFAKENTNVEALVNKGVTIMKTAAENPVATEVEDMVALINQKTGLALDDTGTVVAFRAPKSGNGLTMQVGDTAADFNKITVSVDDMSANGIGIGSISMATQESSAAALDSIRAAIEKVSANRGNLGALQNRLEHTINNLNVTSENMTAAESRIRDVDMAKEMMAFTKNNVLSQAAQAMLAQANMQPQNVLQLLR